MSRSILAPFALALLLYPPTFAQESASVVTINADHVLVIDGEEVFPVGFTMAPPPAGLTPEGRNGLEELADAGATFMRTGPAGGVWDKAALEQERKWQDAAARHGLRCWVYLRELGGVEEGDTETEAGLREVVTRFRDHPGMGIWKGVDEPAWGKHPLPPMLRATLLRSVAPTTAPATSSSPTSTRSATRPKPTPSSPTRRSAWWATGRATRWRRGRQPAASHPHPTRTDSP